MVGLTNVPMPLFHLPTGGKWWQAQQTYLPHSLRSVSFYQEAMELTACTTFSVLCPLISGARSRLHVGTADLLHC